MPREPILYLDCTSTARSGLKTGIQRVVLGLAEQASVFSEILRVECIPMCHQFDAFYRLDDALQMSFATKDKFRPLDFQFQDIYFCPDAFWTMEMHRWYPFFRDRGLAIATLIHDIIPISHPEFSTPEDRRQFESALLDVVGNSDMLLCASQATRRSLHGFQKAHAIHARLGDCEVVPLAPALTDQGLDTPAPADRLPQGDFFLMVGTVEPRRGYVDALREFAVYRSTGGQAELLIIGKQGAGAAEIVQAIKTIGHPVTWLTDAADQELRQAYRGALAVVCPSKAEGYGMAVAEGLTLNGRVLANRLPVFGEFAGAYPYYFDIDRPGELARLLAEAPTLTRPVPLPDLGDWQRTARAIARQLARIAPFHGHHTAIEVQKNSQEAVRWAHWLRRVTHCPPDEVAFWLRFETVSEMYNAMLYEDLSPDAPLTALNLRIAYRCILQKAPTPEDLEYWLARCKTLREVTKHLLYSARDSAPPIDPPAVTP